MERFPRWLGVVLLYYLLKLQTTQAFNVIDVRLVGGNVPWEGRVEINVDGVWGTVCDDGWDLADAHVLCRMLGYPKGATHAWWGARFGAGSGIILADDTFCTGTETNFMQCSFTRWHDCEPAEDSSLRCDSFDVTDVRLVGGNVPWEGRVEIKADGVWGTVCDDGWDLADAHVLCRMLGYPKGATHVWPAAHFGAGSGTILADDLSCTGTETSIMQCPFRQGEGHNCSSSQDSSLRCFSDVRCPYIWELPDVSHFIMSKTEEGQSNYTIVDSMTSVSAILCTRMCSAHARKNCGEYNACSMVKYDDVTRTCSLYHKTSVASPVVCDASSPCFLVVEMF